MSEPALETHPNGDEPRRLRVRLVTVAVHLEVVADDGEHLHPVETQTIRIAASEWPNWHLDVALAQLQEQLRR